MKPLVSVIAITFAFTSISTFAEETWINIATSNDSKTYEIKPGSFGFKKTRNGTPIALVIGKVTDPVTSKVDLYQWYVSATDCASNMGKVVSLNIAGEYQFENDFVFGAGNIGTSLAEAICAVADYAIKQTSDKSL